jgi:hypothetical protein
VGPRGEDVVVEAAALEEREDAPYLVRAEKWKEFFEGIGAGADEDEDGVGVVQKRSLKPARRVRRVSNHQTGCRRKEKFGKREIRNARDIWSGPRSGKSSLKGSVRVRTRTRMAWGSFRRGQSTTGEQPSDRVQKKREIRKEGDKKRTGRHPQLEHNPHVVHLQLSELGKLTSSSLSLLHPLARSITTRREGFVVEACAASTTGEQPSAVRRCRERERFGKRESER